MIALYESNYLRVISSFNNYIKDIPVEMKGESATTFAKDLMDSEKYVPGCPARFFTISDRVSESLFMFGFRSTENSEKGTFCLSMDQFVFDIEGDEVYTWTYVTGMDSDLYQCGDKSDMLKGKKLYNSLVKHAKSVSTDSEAVRVMKRVLDGALT